MDDVMNTVLNWMILAFVVGVGAEIKKLKKEIRDLKDELGQNNAS